MDKRARAETFRQRVTAAMQETGVNRSELARKTGADRTTIGQLLNSASPRLPNAHLAAEIAKTLSVSCDYLLGQTDRPERPGDILAASMDIANAKRTSADEKILEWYNEAAGYKIRHVPATLPDLLKTQEILEWEYAIHLGKSPEQAIQVMKDSQKIVLSGRSDFEIAVPQHEIIALAEGSGYYRGIPINVRRAQLEVMASICEQTYPALRLHLFYARTVFSAPLTIFGPLIAALYIGNVHIAFRSLDRITTLTTHFDLLVRAAIGDARDVPEYLRQIEVT